MKHVKTNHQADVYAPGEWQKLLGYAEERAALGRLAVREAFRVHRGVEELRDIDIYGTLAAVTLTMDDAEITPEDIALANRFVRKVSGFMTTDIPTSVINGNGVNGENDFAANRLCRVLYADSARIEPETAARVKQFFLGDHFQSKYFSENHMLMFRVSRYLAACHYAGERFNQYGASAEEIRCMDHDYLVSFLQYRARRGWAEFDSTVYGVEDFLSLVNLYDCAPDADIKTLAAMSMDTLLISMICDTTENAVYGGAHGRNYGSVVSNIADGFYHIYRLYFGAASFAEVPHTMPVTAASFVYTSAYRPDASLYALVAERTYPYTNRECTHNHQMDWTPKEYGFISKYTYNTPHYSIGCVNHQDSFGAGYEEHQQTNWSLAFAANSRACVTTHHPGNTGVHAYWYGDLGCNCNHLFGHENTVMGIYYITRKPVYPYIHAYVAKTELSEIREQSEKNRLFVRMGDAYAMLQFSAPYVWREERPDAEIVVHDGDRTSDIRLAMVCEAGDCDSYGSFDAFIAAMEGKTLSFSPDTLTLRYGEMELRLEARDGEIAEHSILRNAEQTYPYPKTYDCPWVQSDFDSGVIEIRTNGHIRTMDFMHASDTTAIL